MNHEDENILAEMCNCFLDKTQGTFPLEESKNEIKPSDTNRWITCIIQG